MGRGSVVKPGMALHQPPTALTGGTSYQPPQLGVLLKDAGLGTEAVGWFQEQDIPDVATAAELTLGELQEIVSKRSTVGKVRRLHRLLGSQKDASSHSHVSTLEATSGSVFSRSMLQLSASELKAASLTRLTSESIFSSLMLSVTVSALVNTPALADCEANFGTHSCEKLEMAYMATFGIASAFFLGSCLVTLGAVNAFINVSGEQTTHFVFVASELYASKSFFFISLGLLGGLLPGSCVNFFLRFGQHLPMCIAVTALHWLVWAWQLERSAVAVANVYGQVPGHYGFGTFMMGLAGLAALRPTAEVRGTMRELRATAAGDRASAAQRGNVQGSAPEKANWGSATFGRAPKQKDRVEQSVTV